MDWKTSALERLPAHLEHGDLAPPWEKFPHYERHTMGWRMGAGEDWLGLWHVFVEQLGPDPEARVAYLERHPPAPATWADAIVRLLDPPTVDHDEDDEDDADSFQRTVEERRPALYARGLIASDIAFTTWHAQQSRVIWPWEGSDTPEHAARYATRELWFWSRQVATLRARADWAPPAPPDAWRSCTAALVSGVAAELDPDEGLLSLTRSLCAGRVIAPWQLGCEPSDFADSFDADMGYVDAFRLWGMCCFDDTPQLQRYLDETSAPARWSSWVATELAIGL